MPTDARRPLGRPRNPAVDERIRIATLALLIDEGYAGVTMESVARRAGVAHTTIYRRWPSKAHLVHEVLFPASDVVELGADGSLEQVISDLVIGMVESISRPEARAALPGLLAEYRSDDELLGLMIRRFEPGITDLLTNALADAVARGEARPGVAAATVLETVIGAAMVGTFLRADTPPEVRAQDLLDLVMSGLLANSND